MENERAPICSCTERSHDEVREFIRRTGPWTVPMAMSAMRWDTENGCTECRTALQYYCAWAHPKFFRKDVFAHEEHVKVGCDSPTELFGSISTAVRAVPMPTRILTFVQDARFSFRRADLTILRLTSGITKILIRTGKIRGIKQAQLDECTEDRRALDHMLALFQLYRDEAFVGESLGRYTIRSGMEYIRTRVVRDIASGEVLLRRFLDAQKYALLNDPVLRLLAPSEV
ncbi:MAG: (2Fe-2S)-binding protein [Polyangiales bacterium]